MTENELIDETLPEETTGEEEIESAQTNIEETPDEIPEESTEETIEEAPKEVFEEIEDSVSGGDSIDFLTEGENVEAGIGSDIVEVILSAEQNDLFEKNNELLENLTAVIEKQNAPITEKLLIDYTVSEGLLLLITVFALGIFVGRIIGRILPCKI